MIKEAHYSYYGNVAILRAYCKNCKRISILIDGYHQCCDSPYEGNFSEEKEYISQPCMYRKHINKKSKKRILESQDYRCIYCNKVLPSAYIRDGKIIRTKVHFDHIIPFCGCRNDNENNIVASCNLCNLIKSDKVFQSIEEIKEYVNKKLQSKGIEFI